MSADRFWKAVGGRKVFNAYLAYLTLTAMAFALDATFGEYAMGMLAALGITQGFVAYEDSKGGRRFPTRRAADPVADTDTPEAS